MNGHNAEAEFGKQSRGAPAAAGGSRRIRRHGEGERHETHPESRGTRGNGSVLQQKDAGRAGRPLSARG